MWRCEEMVKVVLSLVYYVLFVALAAAGDWLVAAASSGNGHYWTFLSSQEPEQDRVALSRKIRKLHQLIASQNPVTFRMEASM